MKIKTKAMSVKKKNEIKVVKKKKKTIKFKICMFCMPVGLEFKETNETGRCDNCGHTTLLYEIELERKKEAKRK
ncbi:MAG TPA: hypothetical protein P5136_06405 [Methanofastidiosum sp.]|nr:hypothetical protein [Methanofastidiosum sp.]